MEENEKKALFTNTHGPSEAGFAQIYRSVRGIFRILLFVIAAGFILYGGYHLVRWIVWMIRSGDTLFGEPAFWLSIVEIAVMFFLIVWEATAPKRYAKQQMLRVTETYHGKDPSMTASFYDDEMVFHNESSGSTMGIGYDRIGSCKETKDLFLLITEQRQCIDLSKNGFAGTDETGFRDFMDRKCPNAKRNWRKERTA